MKEKLLAIVGPTAVGKTNLSIHLAKQLNGEIISGDSMQVYRGMDIGTAKIKPEETDGIPHYLLDILDPVEDFSVSSFQQLVQSKITQLNQRHKVPILVGGTGLYVQAVTHHFQFAESSTNEERRNIWEQFLAEHGVEALYHELIKRDLDYARELHPNNTRRVIRAIELIETTGKSMAEYQKEWDNESHYHLVMIGLTMDRSTLYNRINQRVDQMIEEGLVDEVIQVLNQGVPPTATSLQAIGYKEIIQYLNHEISLDQAIDLVKRNSRRFAKRQITWFKRMKEIRWFDVTDLDQWLEHQEIITKDVQESFNS